MLMISFQNEVPHECICYDRPYTEISATEYVQKRHRSYYYIGNSLLPIKVFYLD